MDDEKVVAFLRCSASAPMRLAIEMANLTDRERTAVELCGIRGLTYGEAAEALQRGNRPREMIPLSGGTVPPRKSCAWRGTVCIG